ncbi:hypothetical protein BpHYR1_031957 [Brachionus plicatilis]|uniref:Uncharacterized protein n=1 Tax=Brachionus plicatilis TaxID=10195 RepID=A0A3M7S3Y7_BRAPC|nr:hypothetical protein BpHYR1_031957 [Brachionus plicatilis]
MSEIVKPRKIKQKFEDRSNILIACIPKGRKNNKQKQDILNFMIGGLYLRKSRLSTTSQKKQQNQSPSSKEQRSIVPNFEE